MPVSPCSSPLPCLDQNSVLNSISGWMLLLKDHLHCRVYVLPAHFSYLCCSACALLVPSHPFKFPFPKVFLLAAALLISSINNCSSRSLPAPAANLYVFLTSSRLMLRVHFSEGFWDGQLDALQHSRDRHCNLCLCAALLLLAPLWGLIFCAGLPRTS